MFLAAMADYEGNCKDQCQFLEYCAQLLELETQQFRTTEFSHGFTSKNNQLLLWVFLLSRQVLEGSSNQVGVHHRDTGCVLCPSLPRVLVS